MFTASPNTETPGIKRSYEAWGLKWNIMGFLTQHALKMLNPLFQDTMEAKNFQEKAGQKEKSLVDYKTHRNQLWVRKYLRWKHQEVLKMFKGSFMKPWSNSFQNSLLDILWTKPCPQLGQLHGMTSLLRAMSSQVFSISKDNDPTAFLGTCFSIRPALLKIIFFLRFKQNFLCSNPCRVVTAHLWEEYGSIISSPAN